MNDKNIRSMFGKRVQFFRKEKGLNQAGLAEKAGRSEDTISSIERGLKSTTIETAVNIAEALGVPLADLFDLPLFDPANKAKFELIRQHIALLARHDEEFIKYVHEQAERTAEVFRGDE